MKKNNKLLIIIGLVLIILPYFINAYSFYRFLSILIGLAILLIGLIKDKKDKIWKIALLPLLFFCLLFCLDFCTTHIFKTIPIFAYRVTSSKKVITYNSLFYREYYCNGKIIVDNLYKKSYQCGNSDINEVDANSFLGEVLENYKQYQGKFVKIAGKISKINGTYNLEMQAYSLTEESINGYVSFSSDATLEINFNEIIDLTNYKVYDSITVIARPNEIIKRGDQYIVRLTDSVILNNDLYTDFSISVVEAKRCENDKMEYATTTDEVYYTSCLDNIFIKYDQENVYDLSYVLLDKKITWDILREKALSSEEGEDKTLYKYDGFNILSCSDSGDIIIGNKKLNMDNKYCEIETPDNDEL